MNAGIAVATGVLMIVLSEVLPTYSSRYKEEHSSNITTESVGSSVSGKSADNQAGTVISREDYDRTQS